MKRRKTLICTILALLLALAAVLASCRSADEPYGDPDANREIPQGSVQLTIGPEPGEHALIAFSTELDPHFFSYNVGRSGVNGQGENWECKAEDWDTYVVPRVRDMNLQRIRVMFLPSWVAEEESSYTNREYTFESKGMQSLYTVIDMALELDMDLNLTYWGADSPCEWLTDKSLAGWCVNPAEGMEQQFCDIFTDTVKYLMDEKGYGCIREITIFNEPTGIFKPFGNVKGNGMYCDICRLMHETFEKAGIRDRVMFALSDDTSDSVWLAQTCAQLSDIMDIASSHSYYWGNEHTNEQMQNSSPYAFKNFHTVMADYPEIPHFFGELGMNTGIDTHTVTNAATAERGLTISRIVVNMINSGSAGASYWVLFNQYYDDVDSRIMNMGLWAFADEGYVCRPVYYAYSLFTRFGQNGSDIFTIQSPDPNIAAFALRSPEGKWSYFVVNDSERDISVSFLNEAKFPSALNKYVYDENNVPTDNKVIPSSGRMTPDGRVLTDMISGRSFAVYAE